MYLASGIPVIIWKKRLNGRNFIEKRNNAGVVVSRSLLEEKYHNNITEKSMLKLRKILKIGAKLREEGSLLKAHFVENVLKRKDKVNE